MTGGGCDLAMGKGRVGKGMGGSKGVGEDWGAGE